jgi:hypothetical protein
MRITGFVKPCFRVRFMLKYTSGAAIFKRDSDVRRGFGGNPIRFYPGFFCSFS